MGAKVRGRKDKKRDGNKHEKQKKDERGKK